jgi:protein-tyrosine phosphatase
MITTTKILVLCTANRCRSVMAEALLGRLLAARGISASVRSAGLHPAGGQPLPEVISVMAGYGFDLAAHRSRAVADGELAESDLILTMARDQLRHAVVAEPRAWPRAFTLKELVRRGQGIGPRVAAEPLADWLGRAHSDRDKSALLGDSPDDDIADPAGSPLREFVATAARLDHLLARFVGLAWG